MKLPGPTQLRVLKDTLGKTQTEMAELVGYRPNQQVKGRLVPDGGKWRKLTLPDGHKNQKRLSYPAFFYLAAHLALTEDELARVRLEMDRINGLQA